MYQSAQNDSPFDDHSLKLLSWRRVLRGTAVLLLTVAALVLFVDTVGEPRLRWEYHYRGSYSDPVILDATYIGPSGLRPAGLNEQALGFPALSFVKPSPPLWRQLADRAIAVVH